MSGASEGSAECSEHYASLVAPDGILRSVSDSAAHRQPAVQSSQMSGLYRGASDSASNSSAAIGAPPYRRGGYKVLLACC